MISRTFAEKWRATPGIKVVYGTDAVAGAHGQNARDLVCRVKSLGQPAMEALLIAERVAHPHWGARKLLAVLARRHPRIQHWPAASTVARSDCGCRAITSSAEAPIDPVAPSTATRRIITGPA